MAISVSGSGTQLAVIACSVFLLLAFALGHAGEARGQSLNEVLAALREKRNAPATHAFKIIIKPTSFRDDGKHFKCEDIEDVQIEWPSGRFRMNGYQTCMFPNEGQEVFDGKSLKSYWRKIDADRRPTSDWKYGMSGGSLRNRLFIGNYWPIFFNRGVILHTPQGFYPGHFIFDAPDDKFFLHRKSGPGSPTVVIRSFPERLANPSFFEFTIDPAKQYAVTDFSQYVKEDRVMRLEVDVKNWNGTWAPSGWTLTYATRGVASEVVKVAIDSFRVVESAPGDYDIVPPEGAKVGRSDYPVPSGKDTDYTPTLYQYVVKDGELVQISGPEPAGFRGWLKRNWLWATPALVFVLLALTAIVVRRRRNRPAIPPDATSPVV